MSNKKVLRLTDKKEDEIKLPEPLESFLIKEGVKDEFIDNFKNDTDNKGQNIKDIDVESCTIGRCFVWRDTPQGWAFWNDVHEKWMDYYEELE